jgi:hypothetical protein
MRVTGQQRRRRRRRHDLAGLTITALHDLEVKPRLLNLLTGSSLPDGLDGRNGASLHEAVRQDAGTDRPSVEMDGTGPALGDAASELGAGKTEMIAQHPKQGGVERRVRFGRKTVHVEGSHGVRAARFRGQFESLRGVVLSLGWGASEEAFG